MTKEDHDKIRNYLDMLENLVESSMKDLGDSDDPNSPHDYASLYANLLEIISVSEEIGVVVRDILGGKD